MSRIQGLRRFRAGMKKYSLMVRELRAMNARESISSFLELNEWETQKQKTRLKTMAKTLGLSKKKIRAVERRVRLVGVPATSIAS